jgi:tricorn protease
MTRFAPAILLATAIGALPATAQGPNIEDTRLLSQPAISQTHVAFVYDSDLWVARRDGTGPRRLTTHIGTEVGPRFSPDGQWIAFSGQYDGNTDVFIVPTAGGVPRRLTWHPGGDVVLGFTPDGSAVLFRSARSVHTGRHTQLFTVPLNGGMPTQLPIPHAFKAAYSPGGDYIAYVPLGERFAQWKNYRGGTVARIWIYNVATHAVEEIPQPEGRSNDTDPMWVDGRIVFRSDRNGEFNLFTFDPGTKAINQITRHEDFPILNVSSGAGRIIYEQAGYLHDFDPATSRASRLGIGIAADLNETRPRYASGNQYIRNASIAPNGARAAFEFRGEIVTVPAEHGNPRFVTETPGVHERSPAWSPDGRSIAYFSDASGEYQLHVASQDGKAEVRTFDLDGAGFYDSPDWSPDGNKISFRDNSWSLFWIDVASGHITKVVSQSLYGYLNTLTPAWSPDSKWLAYTTHSKTYHQTIHLYSLETGESRAVTGGLSDAGEPVFDASGKYLYFTASTDAGPIRQFFAQSNAGQRLTNGLYVAVLRSDVTSPLKRQSDEAVAEEGDAEPGADEESDVEVRVDFDGLDRRILALPVPSAYYFGLVPGAEGQLYYLRAEAMAGFAPAGSPELRRFEFSTREEETLLANTRQFQLSHDTKKLLVQSGNAWMIGDAGKVTPGSGRLATTDIEVRIEPRAEWAQIFNEAWRINRDYFYDPNMHGADWPAMRRKYAAFLPDVATRADLNRVMQWMFSELAVGHHGVGGGDRLHQLDNVPGGLLGADYVVSNGRYQFSKVYGGLNWNPSLRSPLTEPGVGVVAGEYLLAVNGEDLRPPENLYSRFENTANDIVEITVGPNVNGSGSRTVPVVPVANEGALRNRDWVEGNLRRVHEATDGRVAYVYVPNTGPAGYDSFRRYFYPQADKDAIIVDERYNGGGMLADFYIDLLRRPLVSYWAMRYGDDMKTPIASIQGPKAMIIDETAGSGGDLLPWMFRKFDMGPLIGKRTWGGLVGTLGFPPLMDGGGVTAPNFGIWTEDGFIIENVGVPPDIDVEYTPAEVIAGRDPQLERAIEWVLAELERNPPQKATRPAFPIRVRREP